MSDVLDNDGLDGNDLEMSKRVQKAILRGWMDGRVYVWDTTSRYIPGASVSGRNEEARELREMVNIPALPSNRNLTTIVEPVYHV